MEIFLVVDTTTFYRNQMLFISTHTRGSSSHGEKKDSLPKSWVGYVVLSLKTFNLHITAGPSAEIYLT